MKTRATKKPKRVTRPELRNAAPALVLAVQRRLSPGLWGAVQPVLGALLDEMTMMRKP